MDYSLLIAILYEQNFVIQFDFFTKKTLLFLYFVDIKEATEFFIKR